MTDSVYDSMIFVTAYAPIQAMLLNELVAVDINVKELLELYQEGYILKFYNTDSEDVVRVCCEKVAKEMPQ